jgi:hypothetical protein
VRCVIQIADRNRRLSALIVELVGLVISTVKVSLGSITVSAGSDLDRLRGLERCEGHDSIR